MRPSPRTPWNRPSPRPSVSAAATSAAVAVAAILSEVPLPHELLPFSASLNEPSKSAKAVLELKVIFCSAYS